MLTTPLRVAILAGTVVGMVSVASCSPVSRQTSASVSPTNRTALPSPTSTLLVLSPTSTPVAAAPTVNPQATAYKCTMVDRSDYTCAGDLGIGQGQWSCSGVELDTANGTWYCRGEFPSPDHWNWVCGTPEPSDWHCVGNVRSAGTTDIWDCSALSGVWQCLDPIGPIPYSALLPWL